MNKQDRITEKRDELLAVFEDLSDNQKKVASDLINQASFLSVTLEDLNDSINENGTVEEYTNGVNQSGRKVSSDAKLYSTLIAKYTAIITKLLKLIPEKKYCYSVENPEQETLYNVEHKTPEEQKEKNRNLHKEWIYSTEFKSALEAGEVEENEFEEFYKDFCEKRNIKIK